MSEYAHQKILVLDASMRVPEVGILENGVWLAFFSSKEPALEAIFQGTQDCLSALNLQLKDISAFAFAEGPGSLLGIRLAAMAIRAWKSLPDCSHCLVYAYNTLRLGALMLQKTDQDHAHAVLPTVIMAARKGFWYYLAEASIKEISTADLASWPKDALYYLPQGKFWETPPPGALPLDYALGKYPHLLPSLFYNNEHPDALTVRQMEFVKWTPVRHK